MNAQMTARTAQRSILSPTLIKSVISDFRINPKGHHGTAHWMRVRANGLRLAKETGANPTVIELFALFHDSQRHNENTDPDHGKRGALNAVRYREMGAFRISDTELELVYNACWGHTYEDIDDPCITIHTCWDADRLDLGRVGIVPDPERLFTEVAKRRETIKRAYASSERWVEKYW
jgi:uncharacterized protein